MMDDTDKKIISMLNSNGRMSFRKMAKELDITHTAVKKRYDKLKKSELIDIKCLEKDANSQILMLLSLTEKQKTIDVAKNCEKISAIIDTYGEYDLGLVFSVQRFSSVSCIMEKCFHIDNVKKITSVPLRSSHYPKRDVTCERKSECTDCKYSDRCETC